ncbi:TetR/AcrR family transcriptional regulator [Chromatiaceae bacterium AAb-1]|nr:TetR/AcrR family transcriptional regulator [Chromatiaceae bacterium AAb-1]
MLKNLCKNLCKSSATPGRPVDKTKDEAIFIAARDLLLINGIQSFTMESVASKAGVSKATLYSRFSNREQLIQAVVLYQSDLLAIDLELQGTDDIYNTLLTFSVQLLEFILSDPYQNLVRALLSSPDISPELLQQIYLHGPYNTHEKLVAWLMEAAQAGALQNIQPECAELFCGMLTGMNWVKISYHQPVDRSAEYIRQQAERAVQSFLTLYRAPA